MNEQASWLADGVREIERVVKASMVVEPKVIKLDQEKPGTYGIVTPAPAGAASTIDFRVSKPLWHNERLETPEQMEAFVRSMQEDRDVEAKDGAIYIGRDSIRYVYSFEDRRDRATCPLILSQPWRWLMQPPGPIDHRAAIRALRIIFADCLPQSSNLVDVLRNVKWKSSGEIEANVQRGKEALGRQILNEAAGITNFPDEFTVTVPVFENVKRTVAVRVALEILPEAQKFELIPFPNQLHDGMTAVLLGLQSQLAETGVPTFIGAPAAGGAGAD